MNKRGSFIIGLAVIVIGAMLLATLVTFGFYLFFERGKKDTPAEPAEVVAQVEEEPASSLRELSSHVLAPRLGIPTKLISSSPQKNPPSSPEEQAAGAPSQSKPQPLPEFTLSPRLRFERSDTTCYISSVRRQDSFPCKMERRSDGRVEEYKLFPTGALNRTTYNPAGEVLEVVGLNPDDTVSFRHNKESFWFFDGPNGTVSQQTVILGQVPPGTYRQAADVIFYNPDGTVRECNCYKSDCCANPMYSLEGKPNTYCTMYPLDKDICEYKKQDNSLPPLPQEANPPQLPIPSNSRRK